jgi:hypothetical protein
LFRYSPKTVCPRPSGFGDLGWKRPPVSTEFRFDSLQLPKLSFRFCHRNHENLRIDRRSDKAIFLIESLCVRGDCAHQNGSNSSDVCRLQGPQNGIAEKIRPNTATLKARVNGKPSYQNHGHRVGHVALCPRSSFCVGHGAGRERIIAGHATTSAYYIGSRSAALFILKRTIP